MGTNIRKLFLSELKTVSNKNLVIGVDLSIFIHKFFAVYKKSNGEPFSVDYNGKKEYTSHFYGLFKKFVPLAKNNKLIFIIDKNPLLEIKKLARDKRRDTIEKRQEKIEKYLEDPRTYELALKLTKSRTTYQINYELMKRVFEDIGWSFIEATEVDSEKYAATLLKEKTLDYFITTDSDTLLFGADYVTDWSFEDSNLVLKVTSLEKTLSELNIDYLTLVKAGIVSGTDYSPGVSGIGAMKAIPYVISDLNLENFKKEFELIEDYFTSPAITSFQDYKNLTFNLDNYYIWLERFNIQL